MLIDHGMEIFNHRTAIKPVLYDIVIDSVRYLTYHYATCCPRSIPLTKVHPEIYLVWNDVQIPGVFASTDINPPEIYQSKSLGFNLPLRTKAKEIP